ncbi:hypothetical protein Bca52824_080302 [Brassica carinata]|nr:hypothetical protein Bca52824_080302 [Brassica carinata]
MKTEQIRNNMESNHEVYAMHGVAAVKFFTQFSPWSSSLLNVFLPLTNRFEFLDMVVMHEVLLWEQEKNEANGQEKEQCRSTRCGSQKGLVFWLVKLLRPKRSHQILFSTLTRKWGLPWFRDCKETLTRFSMV